MREWNQIHRRKRKKSAESPKSGDEVEMTNFFEPLSDETSVPNADGQNNEEGNEDPDKIEVPVKKKKIPPLVTYTHIENHTKTLNEIQKDLKEKLSINCKRDRMIIYARTIEDYTIMRQKIEAAKISYHTYSLEANKPVVSILNGLPANASTLEIKEEPENEHQMTVHQKIVC